MTASPTEPAGDRLVLVWLAIGMLFALLIGAVAGILDWLGGHHVAHAIMTGGATFGGTITIVILLIGLLRHRSP